MTPTMSPTLAMAGLHHLGTQFPLLALLIAVPTVGALCVAVVPRDNSRQARSTGIAASVLTGLLSLFLLAAFTAKSGDYQFVSQHQWLPAVGISWKLGVDGISLFLVVLTGIIFPIALIGPKVTDDVRSYMIWMLLLEAGCIGSFLALDVFLFFVFFEAVLVPMYFLIAKWGFANRRYAAIKFFLYTLTGSAFLFVGMLALVWLNARHSGTALTFDLVKLQQQHAITNTEAHWIFLAFAIAFAVKVPIFPFHTWLGDAYQESPIAGAVVSAAVMVKLGTYGLIRFGLSLFPKAAHDLAPLLLTLAVIGMVYGAIVAAVQRDLKRLVAYASLSHLGFIVLGTFAFTSEGLSGGVLQMVNHGVSTAALFLLLGMIYERRRTTTIADLRGLQKFAPVFAGVFTLVMLSSIGVPGLNGFVGEFLILLGTFISHRWWAVAGSTTIVFAAVYLLWAYQRVFHGEPANLAESAKLGGEVGGDAGFADMSGYERWLMVPLIALIVFLGVYPRPVLDRIEPSVDRVLSQAPSSVHTDIITSAVQEATK